MNIKDAYIHNGEAILKDIQVSGSKLQKLKAGKDANDAYLTWVDVLDFSSFGASGHNHNDLYLKLTGGTLTGALNFKYGTNSADQLIKFESTDTTDSQAVYLGIRRPANTYGLSYKDTSGDWHKVYHDGNLTIATLIGSTAIGDSDEPVYWNGSAFVKCGPFASSSHTHSVKINGTTKTIEAPGGTAVDLGIFMRRISTNPTASYSLKTALAEPAIITTTNGNSYYTDDNGASKNNRSAFIHIPGNSTSHWSQIHIDSGSLKFRSEDHLDWYTVIHSGNIANQSVSSATTATYASNVGAAGTAGTNYVTAANVISMYNWYNTITTTDAASDTAINKWNEIVSFLAGIADTSTLSGILAGYAASGHNHDDVYTYKFSYALPPQKCVKITYTAQNPVIISAGRSNGSSEFVLIGLGYGGDAWTRNQFRCLIPSNNFTWRLSADSCTVEVYHNFSGDGNAVVKVISTESVTFTQTDALSGDADTKRFACYDELTWANIANKPDTATSYGYIGTTQVQASSAQQNLTGIGDSTFSGVMNITGRQSYAEGIRIHDYSGISSIWFRAVNADNYDAGMIGITGSSVGLRFRLPASATGTSPTDYLTIAYGGAITAAGTLTASSTFTAASAVYFTGLSSGTSDVTADTEILTSYAGTSGFANTTGAGQVYRRQASKLYNYIKTAASGDWAINSAKVKTIKSTTNATYYLTFVDSNNTTATAETVYTSANITFNPSTSNLAVTTASGQNMAFKEVRTGGASVSMGVGSGNKNHGVYSNSLSKWLIYADSSDTTNKKVYVDGTIIPTSSGTALTTSNYSSTLNSVYLRLNPGAAEQTVESSISSYVKGVVEFYRSSGDHICFINFANKQNNTKTTLGAIGFRNSSYSGPFYLKDGTYYALYHSGNLTPATLTLSTTAQTFITADGTAYTLKLPATNPYSGYIGTTAVQATSAEQDVTGIGKLQVKGLGKDKFILHPIDGEYEDRTSSKVGYLKITLPNGHNKALMIRFDVEVYDYSANKSCTYNICGYIYTNANWLSTTAYSFSGNGSTFGNLPVRFGNDGTNAIVWIGEATTEWNYPHVTITNVMGSFNDTNSAYAKLISGWTIVFDATEPTNVTSTISNAGYTYGAHRLAGGAAGSIPYQTGSGTTAFLAGSSTNGYILSYNTSTNAPQWVSSGGTHNHDDAYLKLTGGTVTDTITLKAGEYAADNTWTYPGGSYRSVQKPNLRLIGDSTYGLSTIEFISQKGDTSINKPSDCAFIQFQPYGTGTLAAIGSAPTLNNSGEVNRLVIGVSNDSNDILVLQTPATTGLKHVVATNSYTIWDAGNDGSGSGLDADLLDGFHAADFRNNIVDLRTSPQTFNPTYLKDIVFISEVDYTTLVSNGSITKNSITHTYNASNWYVIEDKVPEYAENAGNADYATYAGNVAWENISGKPSYATRWPSWSEVTSKPTWVTWSETSYTASYSLYNAEWTQTITLPTAAGSYMLCLIAGSSTLTGVFSIGSSDTAKDEISLHWHGGTTRLYARTNGTKLELSSNASTAASVSVTIKYRRII